MADLVLDAALRAEADDIGCALGELGLDVLHRTVTPDGVLAVVAEVFLGRLLLLAHLGQLLLGGKAGVGHAALHKGLDKGLIDLGALGLAVRAVSALVPCERRALVKGQAKGGKGVDDGLHAALDLALLVGVLDAQVEHAARLMGQALVHQGAV